jgi:threonine dehydratase
MRWIYDHHGLRTEPSGAITVAALLQGDVNVAGDGDIVAVVSGRNVDDGPFQDRIGTKA